MKRLILPAIAIAFVACTGSNKETEAAKTPSKVWRCDSVEKVTIDSINGVQIFEKVEKCDSVEVASTPEEKK